jgi:hypothetical protein
MEASSWHQIFCNRTSSVQDVSASAPGSIRDGVQVTGLLAIQWTLFPDMEDTLVPAAEHGQQEFADGVDLVGSIHSHPSHSDIASESPEVTAHPPGPAINTYPFPVDLALLPMGLDLDPCAG